jgi:hypothetical protein
VGFIVGYRGVSVNDEERKKQRALAAALRNQARDAEVSEPWQKMDSGPYSAYQAGRNDTRFNAQIERENIDKDAWKWPSFSLDMFPFPKVKENEQRAIDEHFARIDARNAANDRKEKDELNLAAERLAANRANSPTRKRKP